MARNFELPDEELQVLTKAFDKLKKPEYRKNVLILRDAICAVFFILGRHPELLDSTPHCDELIKALVIKQALVNNSLMYDD